MPERCCTSSGRRRPAARPTCPHTSWPRGRWPASGRRAAARRRIRPGFPCWSGGSRREAAAAQVRAAVRAQGARRQAERAAALESDIEALGPDQALYQALMRALGYSANTAAIRGGSRGRAG